jgi:hypothetical protein
VTSSVLGRDSGLFTQPPCLRCGFAQFLGQGPPAFGGLRRRSAFWRVASAVPRADSPRSRFAFGRRRGFLVRARATLDLQSFRQSASSAPVWPSMSRA